MSKTNAYHHCTLLVDCNKKTMSAMLGSKDVGKIFIKFISNISQQLTVEIFLFQPNIITKATRSVPSIVINLRELNPSVNVDRLMTVVGLGYLNTKPFRKSDAENIINEPRGFLFISPEEKYFPGAILLVIYFWPPLKSCYSFVN